jgi:tRNA dimethylallyltransferase
MKPKVIVILGPTAAGKSSLAVKLAQKFNGEIVSADSRQVYKGMDLGSAKITQKERKGIPHHLLDVASPKKRFTVFQYQKLAIKKIWEIKKRGKVPFLVGGSALYLYSVIDGWQFPKTKTDLKLRKKLEKKDPQELFSLLEKIDPERAKNIDKKNKRRLIRALEIAKTLGRVPPLKKEPLFDCLLIGLQKNPEVLKKAIRQRLKKRLRQGMVKEVLNLRRLGLSWKRIESFGLEYKWLAKFAQGKISRQKMVEQIEKDTKSLWRRQLTWFKKDKRIHWLKNQKQAEALIRKFLKLL